MKAFWRSLGFARTGLGYILRRERNARIHVAIAVVVVLAGLIVGLSAEALAAVVFAIVMVFLAEIMNTAIEKTLDLVGPGQHPQVALIKDMMAGAVLVAAGGAIVIGVIVFIPHLWEL